MPDHRDDRFPPPPSMPSLPRPRRDASTLPPAEEDPLLMMIELKASLAAVGDLMTRLTTRLCAVQLATLASEHVARTAVERADEALERLGKIEERLGMAAE